MAKLLFMKAPVTYESSRTKKNSFMMGSNNSLNETRQQQMYSYDEEISTSSTSAANFRVVCGPDTTTMYTKKYLGLILGELKTLAKSHKLLDAKSIEWKFAAMVINRLCLLIFTALNLLIIPTLIFIVF